VADYIDDIETYPNFFSYTDIREDTGQIVQFEISTRRNQARELLAHLWALREQGHRQVGFNNEGFDYPVIHLMMVNGEQTTVAALYQKAMSIIGSDDRWSNIVWENDRLIPQVDLYKIHHFDNAAKSTSLKMLEFNMQSDTIEDLPFPPGTILTPEQMDVVLAYNHKDVRETLKFYRHSKKAIEFREQLSEKYGRNFINFNDTKIGKEYFISELEKRGVQCYDYSTGRREPRQTPRPFINLGDVILPYVAFERPEFQRFVEWLRGQTITETKGVFKDLSVTVDGFTFDFGLGGIHGSIDSATVEANDDYAIIDLDVTSFYPSVAIVNRFYPEHLGPAFCEVYADLKNQRIIFKKGTLENALFKLALNGTFGDTNSEFSVFYDPKCTMSITINGQLLLCMLAEQLMKIPGLRMIQANTDGVTVYCPRPWIDHLNAVCSWWQGVTGLELEEARYSRMFIRDVNNYLAEYDIEWFMESLSKVFDEGDELKRKGAYEYDLEWHQNQGAMIVAKAAEAALVDGEDIRRYIETHPQPLDFMLRTKVPRESRLMWGEHQLQNITRYYISNQGYELSKVMPPVKGKEVLTLQVYEMPDGSRVHARTKTEIKKVEKKGRWIGEVTQRAPDRTTSIHNGWLVTPANDMRGMTAFDFNYEWYIAEAEKLVRPLRRFEV